MRCVHRVGRDAEDVGCGFAEGRFEAGEIDCLFGAAGRVGTRIEIERELSPGEVGERDRSTAIAGQGEYWRFCTGTKLTGHLPSFRRFHSGTLTHNTRVRGWGRSRRGRFLFLDRLMESP
jgi:hypothetical protein